MGKYTNIFGLSWMSDGATISCMPLVNNLVRCADVSPTVVDIHNYTDHMATGDKKDAEYLAGVIEEEIVKFDLERIYNYVLILIDQPIFKTVV